MSHLSHVFLLSQYSLNFISLSGIQILKYFVLTSSIFRIFLSCLLAWYFDNGTKSVIEDGLLGPHVIAHAVPSTPAHITDWMDGRYHST